MYGSTFQAGSMTADANRESALNQLKQRQLVLNTLNQRPLSGLQMPPQQSRDGSQAPAYSFGAPMLNPQPVDTSNLLGSSSSSSAVPTDTYKPHQSHYGAQLGLGGGLGNASWPGGFGNDLLSQPSLSMGAGPVPSFNPQPAQPAPLYVPPSPTTSRKRPADSMLDTQSLMANKRPHVDGVNITNSILGYAGAPPLNYAANNTNSLGNLNPANGMNGNDLPSMNGMNGNGMGNGLGNLNNLNMSGLAALNGGMGLQNLNNPLVGGQNNFFQDANRGIGNAMNGLNMHGMANMGMGNGGFNMNGLNGHMNNGNHLGNLTPQQFYAAQQQQQRFQHYNPQQRGFPQMQQQQVVDQARLAQQRILAQQREAAKQKAKASAIYAKRTELKKARSGTGGDGSDYESDYHETSRPKPRPKKRRVVDSDDDGDDFGDDPSHFAADVPVIAPEVLAAKALQLFNEADETSLTELLNCTAEQARAVIELRPYANADEFEGKLKKVLTKGRGRGVSVPTRMFEECQDQLRGYHAVDSLVESCERTGAQLRAVLDMWSQHTASGATPGSGTRTPDNERDAATHLVAVAPPANAEIARRSAMKDYISKQPALVREEYTLKDYQMLGLNWLNLLYSRRLSCILADEMGLGKTIQVISFLAHLKAHGGKGPHLVIVPSSTLENWVREFERFAPSIGVQTYYGGQRDRAELRATLVDAADKPAGWEVLVTTYNLAQSSDLDRKFLRRIDWETCVFDEGHVLKNCHSQRYKNLMNIHSNWRLLLTGTPLQNNLQELVSLMSFILPEQFEPVTNSLRAIFKVKNEATNMLYRERTMRAKRMMMPFVLRRRKDQVLKDLPKKTERIEWCEMTETQGEHYREVLQRSRKMLLEQAAAASAAAASSSTAPSATATPQPETPQPATGSTRAKTRKNRELASLEMDAPPTPESRAAATKKPGAADLSTNVLMDLRKAASHPALFRIEYDDALLKKMARACKLDEQFKDSNEAFIVEDMSVMTDSELQHFCQTHDCVAKFARSEDMFLNSGKIKALVKLLDTYREAKRRVLIFSQFTQVLDILRAVLDFRDVKYLLLTGQTAVDTRLGLVDEFNQDESIEVFLLSTKAGGMGINLTAASVVILFDQDFNPHNDKQAADRAYRIGQKNDVDVIKLISKGTIEEDIMRLGETKLALDEAVAGETLGASADTDDPEAAGVESVAEKQIKASLVEAIKRQLDAPPPAATKTEDAPPPPSSSSPSDSAVKPET